MNGQREHNISIFIFQYKQTKVSQPINKELENKEYTTHSQKEFTFVNELLCVCFTCQNKTSLAKGNMFP